MFFFQVKILILHGIANPLMIKTLLLLTGNNSGYFKGIIIILQLVAGNDWKIYLFYRFFPIKSF
jgi:hypothetical protein